MALVLVVDDRADNCEYLRIVLSYGGYTAEIAREGPEALTLARQIKPDLMITDIAMRPWNGYQLIEHIRADPTLAEMKVVLCTAMYPVEKIYEVAATYGVQYVVSLAAGPAAIRRMVAAALAGEPPSPAPPSVRTLVDRIEVVIQDLKHLDVKKN